MIELFNYPPTQKKNCILYSVSQFALSWKGIYLKKVKLLRGVPSFGTGQVYLCNQIKFLK